MIGKPISMPIPEGKGTSYSLARPNSNYGIKDMISYHAPGFSPQYQASCSGIVEYECH